MTDKQRILFVASHPDDMEMVAGGTVAKLVKDGHDVFLSLVSPGEYGGTDPKVGPEELAKLRIEQTKKGAEILGVKFLGHLDEHHLKIYETEKLVWKLVDVVRTVKPQMMFTHYYGDYAGDHRNTCEAAIRACMIASMPSVVTDKPPHAVIRTIHCDTVAGLQFEPDFWVNITETVDLKLKALSMHNAPVGETGGMAQFIENARVTAAFRGVQSEVPYAEGFKWVRRNMNNRALSKFPDT